MTQGMNRFKMNYMRSMESISPSISHLNTNNLNQILFSNVRRTPSSLIRIARFAKNTNNSQNRLISLRNKKNKNIDFRSNQTYSLEEKNQTIEEATNIKTDIIPILEDILTNLEENDIIYNEDKNIEIYSNDVHEYENNEIDVLNEINNDTEDSENIHIKKINMVELSIEDYKMDPIFKSDSDTENSENGENDFLDEYWNDENKI